MLRGRRAGRSSFASPH